MNASSALRTSNEEDDKDSTINTITPVVGGSEDDMTYQGKRHIQYSHTGTAGLRNHEGLPTSQVAPSATEEDVDTDIIEVFKFDRNRLKLRCEEISPKQLKAVASSNNAVLLNSDTRSIVKIEPFTDTCSSTSSSKASSNDSSDSNSESDSSSSSSSSESSSTSTNSSSDSNTSKATSTTGTTGTSSSTRNSPSSVSKIKHKSNKKVYISTNSDSTSSDLSSSNETENASSDIEDELNKKRPKRLTKKRGQRPSASKQCTKIDNPNFSTNNSDLTKEMGLFCNTQSLIQLSGSIRKAVPTPHIKTESDDKSDEGKIFSSSKGEVAVKRENEEEEEVTDEMVSIDDLVEGRNKQRKNSKWADYVGARKSSRLAPRAFSNKNYETQIKKRLRTLLKKPTLEWTEDDQTMIQSFPKLLSEVEKRMHKKEVASERLKESEDPPDILENKCAQLASVISRARYLIIYTGAGISTSAKIPDYRGPNGIWTLLQKGEQVTQSLTDISQTADPTPTHMAIKTLYDRQICKHVVSQNVDGLHLRSGIPKVALSEVHGNMYVEACTKCGREFVRLFDVTENTRRHHHKTGRHCYHCGNPLRDTVVLFGEKGSLRWPLNWQGAEYNVDKADVILCLGSSLKVLRRYPWLWSMAMPPQKRPKLYIVNLQWTPKDQFALLKINGKCDQVMEKVMVHLKLPIPQYSRETDSIFTVATSLHPVEKHTKSSSELWFPNDKLYPEKNKDLRNYIRFEPVFKVPIPYDQKSNAITKIITDIGSSDSIDDVDETASLQLKQEQAKQRKRVLKGNNFSWLGNTVISKQQKRKKLK